MKNLSSFITRVVYLINDKSMKNWIILVLAINLPSIWCTHFHWLAFIILIFIPTSALNYPKINQHYT